MDVFTRIIRGWAIGSGLGVELTLQALHRALIRGRPEIHHSDQGLQYAATDYVAALKQRKVQINDKPNALHILCQYVVAHRRDCST